MPEIPSSEGQPALSQATSENSASDCLLEIACGGLLMRFGRTAGLVLIEAIKSARLICWGLLLWLAAASGLDVGRLVPWIAHAAGFQIRIQGVSVFPELEQKQRWRVRLLGDAVDLSHLARTWPQGDLRVLTDPDGSFHLAHTAFESLASVDEVRLKALGIIELLNAISLLKRRSFKLVRFDRASRLRGDGTKEVCVFMQGGGRAEAGGTGKLFGGSSTSEQAKPIQLEQMALSATETYPAVRDCLRLLLTRSDWGGLSNIDERVRDHAGSDLVEQWVGKGKLERFRHTANSPDAAGIHARHGAQRHASPKNPMMLDEAAEMIRGLLETWIRWIVEDQKRP